MCAFPPYCSGEESSSVAAARQSPSVNGKGYEPAPRDSHADEAETFESLILQLIPSEADCSRGYGPPFALCDPAH